LPVAESDAGVQSLVIDGALAVRSVGRLWHRRSTDSRLFTHGPQTSRRVEVDLDLDLDLGDRLGVL
jgi:hypothetical protein